MTVRGRRLAEPWLVQYLAVSAIWGFSFLFIKVADSALAPLQVAFGRVALGALTLVVILALRREGLPREPRLWGHLAVAALLTNAAPFTLFAYGETRVSSVLAGIWNGATPLPTLLAAMAIVPEERPTKEKVGGLVLGFAGVLVILGAWNGLGGRDPVGNLLCFAAACCYGLGLPYVRRYLTSQAYSTVALSTGQLLLATVGLGLATLFVTAPPRTLPLDVMGSVVALGALGTGIAYVLFYAVVRAAGATIGSTVTYVVPIFSTLAGVLILHEPLSWNEPVGAAVVISAAALSQGRLRGLLGRRHRLGRRPLDRRTAA